MSFGWSAGDLVAALSFVHNLYKAFDDYTGVRGEYRDTVMFLRSLIRTLEPLKTFADWPGNAHPRYATDIQEQVVLLRTPINVFIQNIRKFEPSLGWKAKKGRYRNVVRKVQWYLDISKKVLTLKSKIEMHMRVLDTLLQRLTL
ncbi:hypothetical protein VMCG_02333 [Cytospora schulzeri]|uniref:Uncharacterized protein n=1 Tax=Cytospora schulzeri TaxID=448051 RepID=A0A423X246_9PEZI|nr:hypothetical protein VMCG_02333 [Valsa malicola]